MTADDSHHKFTVNMGLYSAAVDQATSDEGDIWYNTGEGRIKLSMGTGAAAIAGPHGSHPMIYNIADAWYPVQSGGGLQTTNVQTNDRAFAYPFYPGRKCTLTDFATRITATPGTGNLRIALYGTLSTGLPGALIADYGQKGTLTANTTISGWTVNTDLQPALYWVVLAVQTTVPPSMACQSIFSPYVPDLVGAPPMSATTSSAAFYTDTGFSGAAPGTFGTPLTASGAIAPLVFAKVTT